MKITRPFVTGSGLLAVILCTCFPAVSVAQGPFGFGLLGGGSAPSGALGNDFAKGGWHVGGLIDWIPSASPVSLRAEAVYDRFGETGSKPFIVGGDVVIHESFTSEMFSGTANVVWGLKRAATVAKPYVIAGAGLYPMRTSNSFHDPSFWHSKTGVNAGAGVTLPMGRFSPGVEARWNMRFGRDMESGIDNASFIRVSAALRVR